MYRLAVELEFDVEADYTPGRPAQLYGPAENCYPEEPAEVHITKLTTPTGIDVSVDALDADQLALLETLYAEEHQDWLDNYFEEDRYEDNAA
jgi:hypothetical protein